MNNHDIDKASKHIQVLVSGIVPQYATEHAAGSDLIAYIDDEIVLAPLMRILIPTNTYVVIPEGFEGQVRPKSGLAIKHGITLVNTPGTIDSDYRGEIKVPVINLGQENFVITPNMKIAQLVISPYIQACYKHVDRETFPNSKRGDNGFGSTGIYVQ